MEYIEDMESICPRKPDSNKTWGRQDGWGEQRSILKSRVEVETEANDNATSSQAIRGVTPANNNARVYPENAELDDLLKDNTVFSSIPALRQTA